MKEDDGLKVRKVGKKLFAGKVGDEEKRLSSDTLDPVVGPTPETDEWKALGKCLDVIFSDIDAGVNRGFVGAKWGFLDEKLATIETSARKARSILRPNGEEE